MYNFLLACGGAAQTAAAGDGCYDWPVIKQIVWLFSEALGLLYKFLDLIGIANIGLVIIIFTLVIKFIVLPLTIQQQKFTKLQNVMQPELRAVQNKYKGQKDQYSMQAMQAETKAVYAKYGVSQTGGCLQSFIQFPVLIALYGALRNIPTAIDKIAATLEPVATAIINGGDALRESLIAEKLTTLNTVDHTLLIKNLYSLPQTGWEKLASLGIDTSTHETFVKLNSFCGWDISQSPWNLVKDGFTGAGKVIGIIAVLIPLLAGFSQWLSFKLTQTKESAAAQGDQMAQTSKMMGLVMPLFSVYICFTLNTGLGIYWCMSSFFQVVLQILINRHYRRIDMDEFIKKNIEKAAAKAKNKREKEGVAGSTISNAANISTKNMPAQRPMSIKDIANMKVDDTAVTRTPAKGSLAAKAAMVQEYNNAHLEDSNARKKYKK